MFGAGEGAAAGGTGGDGEDGADGDGHHGHGGERNRIEEAVPHGFVAGDALDGLDGEQAGQRVLKLLLAVEENGVVDGAAIGVLEVFPCVAHGLP